ncbi:MAG: hypothetical protein HOP15_18940 [Planctomycetes bacterium]|nr:hypothetical protein [Planctomycetota bacterium]
MHLETVCALALLSGRSLAQELVPLLRSNELVAGQAVTSIRSPVISSDRHWAALVNTFASGTATTKRLVVDGALALSVGDALAAPPARVASLVNVAGSIDNLVVLVGLDLMPPPLPPTGRAVLRNGQVVLLSGAPLVAAGLPVGTLCRNIYSCGANARDTVVALVDTADLQYALVRLEFDELGVNVARTVELRTGQALPDGALVSTFDSAQQGGFAQAVSGDDWMWRVTATDGRERLVTSAQVLLRSGDPSPVPGRSILSVHPANSFHHGHDLNDLGGHAALVMLSGASTSNGLLLKNSVKLAQEGDVLASLAPQALVDFAPCVRISNSGQVYWVARTDGPLGNNIALMRDLEVVLRQGETDVQGQLLNSIDGNSWDITADGRYLLARVGLLPLDRALLRIDLGAAVPILGCVPNPGTLRHTAGYVLTGNTIRLTLDGPAPQGALVHLQLSLGEATPADPCGIPTPFGELLIDPTRRLPLIRAGIFANGPVSVDLGIPADPALVDLEIFGQGAFVTPASFMRTNGMRLLIGAD